MRVANDEGGDAASGHLADDAQRGGYVIGLGGGSADGAMRRGDLLDVAGDLDASGGEDHEVVADALEVADDVRREQHGDAGLGGGIGQRAEKLAPGEGI